MPWETRGGRSYYYRKERRGGRVFSVYEGGGLGGQLAEARDTSERKEREQTRAELHREMEHHDRIDALIGEAWRIVQAATHSALEAEGYHLHKRQWRLKRDAAETG
jgi:hypothetical protein